MVRLIIIQNLVLAGTKTKTGADCKSCKGYAEQ